MKKAVLVLLFLLVLVFGVTLNAVAAEVKCEAYCETWSGAKYDYQQEYVSDSTYDLSSYFWGLNLAVKRFYLNIDKGLVGNVEYNTGDQDLSITNLRFGCRVLREESYTIDFFGGLLFIDGINHVDGDDDQAGGTILGINSSVTVADKVILQGSCEVSSEGKEVTAYNVKAGYLLNPDIALTAGYREYDIYYEDDGYNDGYEKIKLSGITLGVIFRF